MCVPALLLACASDPEVRVVTETRIVEVPVEVYRELPTELTDPLSYPESLPERFTVNDMINLIYDLYDTVDLANEDRERSDRIVRGEDVDAVAETH